ncbi:NAD-dependent epimerase/dehydratase family protein [Rothia terrae]|uniref:NAD-dependent epimerase/dehydratase family protein n=1 Tax=Rothia terrae TaxID=396015 RepID=UPI0028823308|nr:SDR family NAD(P)-dependent oxidoreductase [Rothia terrae]MDT0188985.1 SDR family NAD(P)-dependent oxidoreductase [Rothia terrae]
MTAFSQHPLSENSFAKERNERMLVTGASGMLGREVALKLLRDGYQVRVLQRSDAQLESLLPASVVSRVSQVRGSVSDAATVDSAMQDVDGVIHIAAKVSVSGAWDDYVEANIVGTRTMIETAKQHGVKKFIYVSSPSVAHAGSSLVGEGNTAASPEHARGNYARSKAYAEQLALESDAADFRVGVLRPHLIWGPGDTQLVERLIERSAAGRLPLLDGGTGLIDTVYIDNAVDAVVAGYERIEHIHGQPLVVTNGQPRTVAELLTGFAEAAGVQAPSKSIPAKLAYAAGKVIEKAWEIKPGEDEPPMTAFLAEQLSTAHWFDQRKTRELLNWTPGVSIEEGYERLRQFYTGRYTR